jgi:hypothetical protein
LIVEAVFNTETLQARGTPIIIASMVRCSLCSQPHFSPPHHITCQGSANMRDVRVPQQSSNTTQSTPRWPNRVISSWVNSLPP